MKRTKIEGRLGYNHSNDRYGLLASDLWENDGLIVANLSKCWWMING